MVTKTYCKNCGFRLYRLVGSSKNNTIWVHTKNSNKCKKPEKVVNGQDEDSEIYSRIDREIDEVREAHDKVEKIKRLV